MYLTKTSYLMYENIIDMAFFMDRAICLLLLLRSIEMGGMNQ